jgi:hypothetical protein
MFNWLKSLFTKKYESNTEVPVYSLGAKLDAVDYRDITVDQLPVTAKKIPDSYMTSLSGVPVQNQLSIGSCCAQADGTIIEYLNKSELGDHILSRRYLYALAKAFDGMTDQGTQPRFISSILRNYGVCTTDKLVDDNTLSHSEYITIENTQTLQDYAQQFKTSGYASIRSTNADSLKQALIQYGLVSVTLPVDYSCGWNSKTGFLNKKPQVISGYHRIVVYGYSTFENETIFYFRNSWGELWGKGGNGTFVYSCYENLILDARVYTDIPRELIDEAKNKRYIFTQTLKRGDSGNDVRELQKLLGVLQADGKFGIQTEEVVKLFQKMRNLKDDGVVGAKTREQLNGTIDKSNPSINDMAEAIKIHEGWYKGSRSWRNKNPGNLRKSMRQIGTDGGFAVFATEQDGMNALCEMIKNARDGKSKIYKSTDTLREYFSKYAPDSDNNNSLRYAQFVAQKLKVTIDFTLRELV